MARVKLWISVSEFEETIDDPDMENLTEYGQQRRIRSLADDFVDRVMICGGEIMVVGQF